MQTKRANVKAVNRKVGPANTYRGEAPIKHSTVWVCMVVLGIILSLYYGKRYDANRLVLVPAVFLVLNVLFAVVWLSWLYPFYYSPLRNIPTVPGLPLWGQFIAICTKECGVPQREWHKKYGPVIRYFFPLGAERLSIAHDGMLKHITSKDPYNFPKPVRAKLWMERILGEGVLLAEGHAHVTQRKALTPAFSTQAINELQPIF